LKRFGASREKIYVKTRNYNVKRRGHVIINNYARLNAPTLTENKNAEAVGDLFNSYKKIIER
jgi:hypothetical protein